MMMTNRCLNRSAPVVPPPPGLSSVEWVIKLQRVSASQNSPAPLGPNAFDFCSPTDGCSALIDSGTFDIAIPPEYFPSLLQLLGLPASPPLVGTNVTGRTLISAAGYPQISCDARDRPGPTIDFQIQVRRIAAYHDLTLPRHPLITQPTFKHACCQVCPIRVPFCPRTCGTDIHEPCLCMLAPASEVLLATM